MDEIYIKLKIKKSNLEVEEIREAGLLFVNIADATCLDSSDVVEIDENNYLKEIEKIKTKYSAI